MNGASSESIGVLSFNTRNSERWQALKTASGMVVDKQVNAHSVSFIPEYGGEGFSPIHTVQNKCVHVIGKSPAHERN